MKLIEKQQWEAERMPVASNGFRLWKAVRYIYGENELMLGYRRSIERVKKDAKL